MASPRFVFVVGAVTAAAVLAGTFGTTTVAADTSPVLLLIDRDSIAAGLATNGFTTQDVNEELASIGMRDPLPYFRRNSGRAVVLSTGQGANPGWLAPDSVPANWASEPGETDGLSNFLLAGPGLGSPEESGERTRLLAGIRLSGIRGVRLQALRGRTVCAVVFHGDLAEGVTDLTGPTLGIVAFRVTGVSSGETSPTVEAEILDTGQLCLGTLVLPPDS